jgi:cytochrome c oxidase cbb3-type subunit III
MSDEKLKPMDHSYDGIQEFDNPLPAWWLITFFGTIIFAGIYYLHYESGTGLTQMAELKGDLAAIEASAQKHAAKVPKAAQDVDLKALLASADVKTKGKDVYMGKCATCHGNELQGMIGPNLVDNYWIHGKGELNDIMGVVKAGVLDKGMPSWQNVLKDDEVTAVTVYIGSMQGTSPPNPKAPQGEKVVSQ